MENSGFGFGECAESGDSKLGRGMNKVSKNSADSTGCVMDLDKSNYVTVVVWF